MKCIYNDRGSALLMVLFIVLVFTILGMSLLTMNISAAKQFNKKEEIVQARHQAEMGVLHYKAGVDKAVKEYNAKDFVYIKKKVNGVVVIDEDASLKKYYIGLCEAAKGVSIVSPTSSNGKYNLNIKNINCEIVQTQVTPTEIVLLLESVGEVNGTSKIIDAKVTIASGTGTDIGNDGPDYNLVPGNVPQKPAYPEENWLAKPYTTNLDEITNSVPARVVHATTKKNPYVTPAFVEIVGAADMAKNSNWTFKDHLIIAGSFKTNTGGNEDSIITVSKDFFIGGALHHLSNHTKSYVGGNFIVMGDVALGTKSNLSIGGNALFDWGISLVDTHAQITIQHNAYFKKPLGNVKNNATVCVKGDIFLWKNNSWDPYLPTDTGYAGFTRSCLGTSSGGESFNWVVQPLVGAEYK